MCVCECVACASGQQTIEPCQHAPQASTHLRDGWHSPQGWMAHANKPRLCMHAAAQRPPLTRPRRIRSRRPPQPRATACQRPWSGSPWTRLQCRRPTRLQLWPPLPSTWATRPCTPAACAATCPTPPAPHIRCVHTPLCKVWPCQAGGPKEPRTDANACALTFIPTHSHVIIHTHSLVICRTVGGCRCVACCLGGQGGFTPGYIRCHGCACVFLQGVHQPSVWRAALPILDPRLQASRMPACLLRLCCCF